MSPVGIQAIGWRYYIPACIWNAILILVVYLTFVETTGMTLEEIACLFDGSEALDNAAVAIGNDLDKKNGEPVTLTHEVEKA